MRIKTHKHNGLFASWLISYILLLSIIIVISIIVYLISLNIIEKENNENSMMMMKQIQQIIDSNNEEVQKLSYQIASNYYVESFIHNDEENVAQRIPVIVKMIDSFKRFYTTSNIKDFYVYFFDSDFIITPSAKYDNELFYMSTHKNDLNGYDDWYKMISTSHTNEILTYVVNHANEEKVQDIAYIQSIPITDVHHPLANIVILYDEQKILKLIDRIEITNKGNVFIINGHDEIIFKSGEMDKLNRILQINNMDKPSESFHIDIQGEKHVITYVKSANTTWKYVSIVRNAVYEEKVFKIKIVLALGILTSVLLGVITSYLLTLRNYKPVNRIIIKLLDKPNSFKNSHENEYDFINLRLRELINDNNAYEKERKKEDYSNSLIKLIKGKKNLSTGLSYESTINKFDFLSDEFAIIICSIENEESEEQNNYYNIGLVKTLNSLYELDSIDNNEFKLYTVQEDSDVIFLLNFNERTHKNKYIKHLLDISIKMFMLTQKNFGYDVCIANSLVHTGIDQINVCYSEAEKTLESRILFDDNILSYKKIMHLTNNYSYTLDNENKLIGYILSGNCIKAKEHFESLHKDNLINNKISIEALKGFFYEIESSIIKACNKIGNIQDYIDGIMPFVSFSYFRHKDEIKTYLEKIILDICSLVNENRKSHNFEMRDEIIEIVNNNYGDINMNIASIAEILGINSSYLSNFFKDQTGQNLLNYINDTRFNKAKELLVNDSLNLNEISSQVGLHNSHSLIRIFKKHIGMTPGQYREISLGEVNRK